MEDRANILKQMKVCRFCLSDEENNLTSIHERLPKNSDINIPLPTLPLQIMACIAIEVVKNDNMPQYICNNCRELTTQAYIFKTNCKKADDALKLFLVTGQLSKPYMQNLVHTKVLPVSERTTKDVHEDTEKSLPSPVRVDEDESQMEFEEIEDEEEGEKEQPIAVEVLKRNKTSPVPGVKIQCYSCTECDRSFALKQLLDIHVKNHSRERNYECEVCQNKFYTKYDLQKHILTHNPNKEYECVVCHKTFAREAMLRRHEKIHVDAPKYVCIHCEKTFLTKEFLDFHMQKHNQKKPFTCNICNKSFVFKQGLERHEIVHSENKPYKCNYCEASFTSAIKLTRHITSHAGLRPYPCKLCGRTFLLSHHLTRHMRSHYSAKSAVDSVGQHKCDICSMSFRKKDSLINHSVIHSMVNLKCVICNTTFETASSVKEHITTHLTGLPFPCEKCDYSFETSEQLEEHELKHAEMEYEEQIEKEVFTESMTQQDFEDEVEDGEVREYTIVDVNNPESGITSNQEQTEEMDESAVIKDFRENFSSRVEFLKDEIESESDQDKEDEEVVEEEEEDEEEIKEIQVIKPIVRQEGTKMYERKNIPATKPTAEIRMSSLNDSQQEHHQQTTLPLTSEAGSLAGKKVGDKFVKVQKFILTKDEMKAMAKKGILEVRNGQVVLKSGGQQILNATMKPIQKNEIDSLLDKRQNSGNKLPIKRYEKKVVPGQET